MLLGQKGASDTVEIYQLPAWQDNYIYVLHEEGFTVVIDPTEAQPVVDLCTKWGWKLKTILITHHHPDHIHGVNELKKPSLVMFTDTAKINTAYHLLHMH